MTDWLVAAAVGLGAGLLSGMFGVGGGVLTIPAIRLLLGYPELIAIGTSLLVILPTAITGAIAHTREGNSRVRIGLIVGAWGIPASVLGALLTRIVGGNTTLLIVSIVIVLAAIDIVRPGRRGGDLEAGGTPGMTPIGTALLGLGTGFMSGLLGLAGGFVLVPLLRRFAGLGVKEAIGTSLVAVALFAIPGSLTHFMVGNVDIPLALALSAGVVPGALLGTRITLASGERGIRLAFAAFLLIAGLTLGLTESGLL